MNPSLDLVHQAGSSACYARSDLLRGQVREMLQVLSYAGKNTGRSAIKTKHGAQHYKKLITIMNQNHHIENELVFLETVLRRPIGRPFSAGYWLARLDILGEIATLPNHKFRLAQLKSRLPATRTVPLAA